MKKIIILVLGLSLLAAACNKSSSTSQTGTNDQSSNTNQDVFAGNVEIDITPSGFNPANITVKSGTVVTFKNTASLLHEPASDPHPSHTDLPGFDSGKGLSTDETYSFTFTKIGKWGFHDHLNPSSRGSVTVIE